MPTQCIMRRQGRCLQQENRILELPAGKLFQGLFSSDRGETTVSRISSANRFQDRRKSMMIRAMSAFASSGNEDGMAKGRDVPIPDVSRCSKLTYEEASLLDHLVAGGG